MDRNPRITFVTLGCVKNEVDTDKMQARLVAAGFSLVDDVNDADLVIVNTCAFLASAVEESIEVIFDLVGRENAAGEELKVLVAGCMPSRYGDSLSEELVEAAGFLAAGDEDRVVEEVTRLLGIESCLMGGGPKLLRHAHPSSAYVKISDGCDRFCSYCMIPHIRGRYHSYTLDQIDDEVAELVCNGVREIVLIGQDTGIWGHDLDEPSTTAGLVNTLACRYPDTWFRLLYVQPEGITDDLLDVMATRSNVCSYLDMPLQHVNAEVLARMNRRGDARGILALIEHVRERVPGIMIRTTLMAGFPGETEEQFEELLDFVDEHSSIMPASSRSHPRRGAPPANLTGCSTWRSAWSVPSACSTLARQLALRVSPSSRARAPRCLSKATSRRMRDSRRSAARRDRLPRSTGRCTFPSPTPMSSRSASLRSSSSRVASSTKSRARS